MNTKNWKQTIITCFGMLITGFMNGHTQVNMGIFVGPQTGNLINMALNLSFGLQEAFLRNFTNFTAFLLGCIIGTLMVRKIKGRTALPIIGWTTIVVPFLLYMVFFKQFHFNISIFILSITSGIAISIFRKIADVELNNIIQTGNMRTFSMALLDTFFMGNKEKMKTFLVFGTGIGLFFLGSFLYGITYAIGENSAMIFALILSVVPYAMMMPGKQTEEVKEQVTA